MDLVDGSRRPGSGYRRPKVERAGDVAPRQTRADGADDPVYRRRAIRKQLHRQRTPRTRRGKGREG